MAGESLHHGQKSYFSRIGRGQKSDFYIFINKKADLCGVGFEKALE